MSKVLIATIDYTDFSGISETSTMVNVGYTLTPGAFMSGRVVEFDNFFAGGGQVNFGIGIETNSPKWFNSIALNDAEFGNIIVEDGAYQETKTTDLVGTPVFYNISADNPLSSLTAGHCRVYVIKED